MICVTRYIFISGQNLIYKERTAKHTVRIDICFKLAVESYMRCCRDTSRSLIGQTVTVLFTNLLASLTYREIVCRPPVYC